MINIFDSKKTKIRNSKSRKRVTKKKREKANEELGKRNLSKLSPMAYPILALHYKKKKPSEWIVKSFVTINSSPHTLTDKWIKSINTWVSQVCESMSLDEPDITVGARSDIGPIEIVKISHVEKINCIGLSFKITFSGVSRILLFILSFWSSLSI